MRIEKAIRSVCMGIGLAISILIPVSAQAACVLYLTVPVYDGQTWTERCDVQVNGVVVPDPPGCTEVVRIAWDWGDGFVGDSWFPAQHTYDTNGLYDVTVTPYDA